MLSMACLIQSKGFVGYDKNCGLSEGGEMGSFWCKWASNESFCPSIIIFK